MQVYEWLISVFQIYLLESTVTGLGISWMESNKKNRFKYFITELIPYSRIAANFLCSTRWIQLGNGTQHLWRWKIKQFSHGSRDSNAPVSCRINNIKLIIIYKYAVTLIHLGFLQDHILDLDILMISDWKP